MDRLEAIDNTVYYGFTLKTTERAVMQIVHGTDVYDTIVLNEDTKPGVVEGLSYNEKYYFEIYIGEDEGPEFNESVYVLAPFTFSYSLEGKTLSYEIKKQNWTGNYHTAKILFIAMSGQDPIDFNLLNPDIWVDDTISGTEELQVGMYYIQGDVNAYYFDLGEITVTDQGP